MKIQISFEIRKKKIKTVINENTYQFCIQGKKIKSVFFENYRSVSGLEQKLDLKIQISFEI